MNSERRALLWYSAAVLFTTIAAVTSLRLLHIADNWAANALMFVPGILAAIFLARSAEGFRPVGWSLGKLNDWGLAVLLPLLVLASTLRISIWLGYAAFAPTSPTVKGLIAHPVQLALKMAIYIAISIPFAFGEELGWRGYAQPRLIRQFGLVKGLFLLGLFWGAWHTPIYYAMVVFPKHPIAGPFVMTPIDNILAVVPMAWFYLRSRNIWLPTFLHAFADILWGFSDLIWPKSHEVHAWVVLQAAQLALSILMLMDLRRRQLQEAKLGLQALRAHGLNTAADPLLGGGAVTP
jgi:membrane protease YdiL (CAAX protease family)